LHSDRCCVEELSIVALGGKIVSVSDEFFAEAFHLILVEVSSYSVASFDFCSFELLGGLAKLERSIRTERRSLQWLGNPKTQF
jgi:hypothetical protein